MAVTKRDSKKELMVEIKKLMDRNEYLYKKCIADELENENLRGKVTIMGIVIGLLFVFLMVACMKILGCF